MKSSVAVAVLLAVALALGGCSMLRPGDPECPPVDPGGDCFAPSEAAFADHALSSASAWPQLDGRSIVPGKLIEAFDEVTDQPTWIVPLLADGRVVAASRFLPHGDEVRLSEVALYEPARADFPAPGPAQRLVLFSGAVRGCGDPMAPGCLFSNYAWRFDPVP